MAGIGDEKSDLPNSSFADMLKNLNLTVEEEAVATFSDDEEEDASPLIEWTLVGKVLL